MESLGAWQAVVREAAARAVGEDVGPADLTSRLVPADRNATAVLLAREPCVLAGLEVAEEVFREVDGHLKWKALAGDGDSLVAGQKVAEVSGCARSILTGERCALNFLQRLSGIATRTAELDTRKTTPGLRVLEKHAVRCGGGVSHRMGLYDAILIKENHLALIGEKDLAGLIRAARENNPGIPLIVEADRVDLAKSLLAMKPDRILLDNLSPEEVQEVVEERRRSGLAVPLEASGGVNLERARQLAAVGVDFVSVGELTHSPRAMDFALDWKK
ncbi:MAG: carboxylating nicotinate-nucleotide diphosphorylase [Verrucomicrobia bacterium]|nr:carboxylating nicotinate-nucleotide diphosphorylase [Verrucomicrobiota bacterium]